MSKQSKMLGTLAFLSLSACSSPEQSTIDQFFRAVQDSNGTAMRAISLVSFDETVESWRIVELIQESTQPFELEGLRSQLRTAGYERDDQLEEGRKYLVKNREALETILAKLEVDQTFKFRSKLGKVQQKWSQLVDDRKAKERAVQNVNRTIAKEIKLVEKSLLGDPDVESLVGNVLNKDILVIVNSSAEERPFTVTLRKYDLKNRQTNQTPPSRWLIVNIQEGNL